MVMKLLLAWAGVLQTTVDLIVEDETWVIQLLHKEGSCNASVVSRVKADAEILLTLSVVGASPGACCCQVRDLQLHHLHAVL
jgi:hypothetical protein